VYRLCWELEGDETAVGCGCFAVALKRRGYRAVKSSLNLEEKVVSKLAECAYREQGKEKVDSELAEPTARKNRCLSAVFDI
jgi:hypothetical protein